MLDMILGLAGAAVGLLLFAAGRYTARPGPIAVSYTHLPPDRAIAYLIIRRLPVYGMLLFSSIWAAAAI